MAALTEQERIVVACAVDALLAMEIILRHPPPDVADLRRNLGRLIAPGSSGPPPRPTDPSPPRARGHLALVPGGVV